MSMSHLWLDPLAFNPTMFLFSMFKFNLVGRHQALKLCSKDALWKVLSNDLLKTCNGRLKPTSSVPGTGRFYIKLAPVKTICVLGKQLKMISMSMSHVWLNPLPLLPAMFLFSMFKLNLVGRNQALKLCSKDAPWKVLSNDLIHMCNGRLKPKSSMPGTGPLCTRENNLRAW